MHLPQPTNDQWADYENCADREDEEEEEKEEEEDDVSLAQYLLTRPGVSVPLHQLIFRVVDLSRKEGSTFSMGEFARMFPHSQRKSIENGVSHGLYKKHQLKHLWKEQCWDY